MKPLVTILTPTYNRGHLLNRIFLSLQKQTHTNFEWIIVDDGSTDKTTENVKAFYTKKFNLYYYKKENGGKHTALNLGFKKANGEFILILDSDDFLPLDAIEIIIYKTKRLSKNLGGIVCRKSNLNGELIGSDKRFEELITNSLDIRYRYKIKGDLTEVFKTKVLKQNLFPEFKNEKFCPEVLIWNRIAKEYDLLFSSESIYIADYQSGGLTDKITKIRMNSPKATMLTYSELASYKIPYKEKIKANINFWRFSFNDKDWSFNKKLNMSSLLLFPIAFSLGFGMHIKDKRKTA